MNSTLMHLEKFSLKMGHLLNSGIPLLSTLDILAAEEQIPQFAEGIRNIQSLIKNGKRLSQAMEEYPNFFSKSYIGMIRASESQGTLDIMLPKIAEGLRSGLIALPAGESSDSSQKQANDADVDPVEVVKLFNTIMSEAFESKASDVHIVPTVSGLEVHFRIDGTLKLHQSLEKQWRRPLIARIKFMCDGNLGEERLPQDRRMQIDHNGKHFDIRVGFLPSVTGEKVTLRVFSKDEITLDPKDLFQDPKDIEVFSRLTSLPYGIVVVSGPTGCGKTTTAYSALNAIVKNDKVAIATAEDPVEYIIDGTTQIQVRPEIGLDFPTAIASIMRNDPDVVYIGEIRDDKTMALAVKVAVTGHLVFATLHSLDTVDVIRRLLSSNVPAHLIASSLAGIITQRLVRKVCPKCIKPLKTPLKSKELELLEIDKNLEKTLVEGTGCEYCNQTGYRGRIAIFEIYTPSKDFKDIVLAQDMKQITSFLENEKFRRIRQSALDLVISGKTTLIEAARILAKD